MNITEVRKRAKMTQKAFAEYIGVAQVTVEMWDRGLRNCPDYLLDLIVYKLTHEGLLEAEPEDEETE